MVAHGAVAVPSTSAQLQDCYTTLQQLRARLRRACGHDTDANARSSSDDNDALASSTAPLPRTVDAATLELLASPHYPFSLCEEAPPSYAPPAVPFDVEGEVNELKAQVCVVQAALEAYVRTHATPSSVSPSPRDVLRFLQQQHSFAALTTRVSSLQWLHRWVLTHSISRLWNAKEQLEYVLRDRGQSVPRDAAAMDEALRALTFAEAVALLQQHRRDAVAEERRRLHSCSRTYRTRLPACALCAMTGRYVTREELYLYQETYNHTEHARLQRRQARDVRRTVATRDSRREQQVKDDANATHVDNNDDDVDDDDDNDNDALDADALAAARAEVEMLRMLLDVVAQRRDAAGAPDDVDAAAAATAARYRCAQVAVYSCVLSDLSLMAYQIGVAATFLEHYDAWLRYHGCTMHDTITDAAPATRAAMTRALLPHGSKQDNNDNNDNDNNGRQRTHTHFAPPLAELARYALMQPAAQTTSSSLSSRC